MGTTLNKKSFSELITENIAELEKYMPEHSLEKKHIIAIMKDSLKYYYGSEPTPPCSLKDKRSELIEVAYNGYVKELDSDVEIIEAEKRMYRKGRRRELRYREPRFLNRKKPEGWLPPSIQRRYDAHVKLINLYQEILPIKEEDITIEIGQFDTAKLINPEISGIEYQQGDLYGYENVKAFLFAREKGCCQMCNEEIKKGQKIHIHHCKERGEAGTNSPKNLALLHEKCHKKLHKKGMKLSAPKEYKSSTFMAIIANKFKKDFPKAKLTYGYITAVNRKILGLSKTHYNDAFVIAGGQNQERCETIVIRQKHRNNRVLQLNRKGFAPSIRKQRYKIQPKDLIWINGEKLVVSGTHNKGKNVMCEGSKKSIPVKKIEKIFNFGTFAYN